jgi:membrane protein HdeD
MVSIVAIMNIIGGLVLCAGVLAAIPAVGKTMARIGRFLGGFQIIIGLIALVLGLINLDSWQGIVLTLVGIILLSGFFYAIPAMGKYLERAGRFLGGFQTIIGIIALIIGIWGLF